MPGGGCPDDDTDRRGGLRGILHWRRTAYGCEGESCRYHESGQLYRKSGRADQFHSEYNTHAVFFQSGRGRSGQGSARGCLLQQQYFHGKTDYGAAFRRSEDQGCKVCDSGGDQACLCVGGGRRLLRQPG